MGLVLTINQLTEKLKELKDKGKVIVSTNGCFDILHVGHVRYLQMSKALGDILIVCLNSDASVRKLKGDSRPLNNENDRAEILAALDCVDFVVIFEEDTPVSYLAQIKPDIHTKGGDYDIKNLPEAKVVVDNGGILEFVKFVDGKSTTNIVEKMKS
ncbi:MAG: D-glycero-beta-D-manno-heptose 1-phosphate adenylyltransferase [Candidatus Gastranaerophilales bacterium]|nr:D-glycero-beta-D-manno-heptose 1-phosphate adenylyltransferase [Candidatus Gastranaerophilales bacterium]